MVSTRPIEVEVKLPVQADRVAGLCARLEALAARRLNEEDHEDIYFAHPTRSFAQTDEALRLRKRIPVDATVPVPLPQLTYKGPKLDKTTKTRQESTVEVSNSESLLEILESLGFRRMGTVRKHRVFYDLDGTVVSLDRVDQVGTFVEVEMIARDESEVPRARERVFTVIKSLNLNPADSVRESYLELLLARMGE
ncbi:MAG: class IV adenylate cyclase [Candidatus Thorarchaeota archaeon]|nr:class IV adenylate cyclase [Candidatus Thorarchaeota archaeon]